VSDASNLVGVSRGAPARPRKSSRPTPPRSLKPARHEAVPAPGSPHLALRRDRSSRTGGTDSFSNPTPTGDLHQRGQRRVQPSVARLGNRVHPRCDLPIPRRAAGGLPNFYVGPIEGSLHRGKHPGKISLRPGPAGSGKRNPFAVDDERAATGTRRDRTITARQDHGRARAPWQAVGSRKQTSAIARSRSPI
jgi:hypothetical protein